MIVNWGSHMEDNEGEYGTITKDCLCRFSSTQVIDLCVQLDLLRVLQRHFAFFEEAFWREDKLLKGNLNKSS